MSNTKVYDWTISGGSRGGSGTKLFYYHGLFKKNENKSAKQTPHHFRNEFKFFFKKVNLLLTFTFYYNYLKI